MVSKNRQIYVIAGVGAMIGFIAGVFLLNHPDFTLVNPFIFAAIGVIPASLIYGFRVIKQWSIPTQPIQLHPTSKKMVDPFINI